MPRYRLDTLSKEAKNWLQQELQYIAPTAQNQILDELDKTGSVSPTTLRNSGLSQEVIDAFPRAIGTLPSESEAQNIAIRQGENVDPSTLSDQELQDRINLLQTRGQTPQDIDSDTITRAIQQKFKAYNVEDTGNFAKQITDWVMQNKRYPSAGELKSLFVKQQLSPPFPDYQKWLKESGFSGKNPQDAYNRQKQDYDQKNAVGTIPPQFENFINDQEARNDLSDLVQSQLKGTDLSTEISSLKGLQTTRADEASKNLAVSGYLGTLKGELSKGTDQFIKSQQAAAQGQLRDVTFPSIAQNLNTRGLLFSGDLPSEASSAVGSSQAGIESQFADLLTQDLAFFENAAYSDQLKKSLVAGQDYASQLQAEEASQIQSQEQRFSASESKLTRQSQLDLARISAETSLKDQQRILQQQQDRLDKEHEASLIGEIGSVGGTIIGAAAGGVPGAIVGGAAGGNIFRLGG